MTVEFFVIVLNCSNWNGKQKFNILLDDDVDFIKKVDTCLNKLEEEGKAVGEPKTCYNELRSNSSSDSEKLLQITKILLSRLVSKKAIARLTSAPPKTDENNFCKFTGIDLRGQTIKDLMREIHHMRFKARGGCSSRESKNCYPVIRKINQES